MDWLINELLYAARGLRRSPSFALTAVLTLALGIGVNAAMYGAVRALLLREPPLVRAPEELVRFYFTRDIPGFGANTQRATSVPLLRSLAAGSRTLAGVAAEHELSLALDRGEAAREVPASIVSSGYFGLLGVRPALGRFFLSEEDRAGAGANVVVLSYELWADRFGARPDALGRTLRVGDGTYTVVGVAPRRFAGLGLTPPQLWLPLPAAADLGQGAEWSSPTGAWVELVARPRAGVPLRAVEQEVTARYKALGDPLLLQDRSAAAAAGPVQVARGPHAGSQAAVGTWLLAMAAVVLAIACANLANLFVQRGLRREHETAVRLALGVPWGRLAVQLVAESAVLAVVGGAAAVGVSFAAARGLRAVLFRPGEVPGGLVDAHVVAVAFALTVAAAALFALLPLAVLARRDLVAALKAGERKTRGKAAGGGSLLLAGQVACSVLLMVAAGLFIRSSLRLTHADPGFDADHVVMVKLPAALAGATAPTRGRGESLVPRLAALPQVRSVGFASVRPLSGAMPVPVSVPGRESLPGAPGGGPFLNAVSEDFFSTLGVPVLSGRVFGAGVPRNGVVVNQTMARLLWPRENPVGRCVRLMGDEGPCREVIGVVKDTRNVSLREPASMQVYTWLTATNAQDAGTLLLRTDGDPGRAAGLVRHALYGADPDLPFVDVVPLRAAVQTQAAPLRFGAFVLGLFGLLSLALTTVGLYGTVASTAGQRRRGIGLRLALGSSTRSVVAWITAHSLGTVGLGALAGLALSLLLLRWAKTILFSVGPNDLLTYASATLLLAAVGLAAAFLPAVRATRTEPVTSLRDE